MNVGLCLSTPKEAKEGNCVDQLRHYRLGS